MASPSLDESRDFYPRQYSVRNLLTLTLVVSILLTIGVLSRGSPYFGAFASPWTAASLLPIVAVWTAHRWHLASPRALFTTSLASYGLAFCLPAFALGDEIVFGWTAYLQSFLGLEYFHDRHVTATWLFVPIVTITIPWAHPIACAVGAAANLAYLTALGLDLASRKQPNWLTPSHRAATAATILAIAALLPMCLTGDLTTLYPGFGFWAASFLALALATRQGQPTA